MPAALQPRLIRYRDAPSYCGVGRRVFDRDIRPWMIVIPIGKEGVAFDRLDLDAWIEQHKSCSGRPPEKGEPWDAQERRESLPTRMETRLSTRSTKAGESFAASAPSVSKKPNNGSPGKPKSDARPASLVRALNAISQMRQKSI